MRNIIDIDVFELVSLEEFVITSALPLRAY